MKNIWKRGIFTLLMALMVTMAAPSILPSETSMATVEAAKMKINATSAILIKGQSGKLKIKNATSTVTWSSNKPKVAYVNKNGKVTALKKGTAVITAKVAGQKFKCKIYVENPKINKTSATISEGDTFTLKVNGTSQTVKWSSSKNSVATVSSKGVVTGKKAGKAVITAKVGKAKYQCTVIVESNPYNTLKNFLTSKGTKSGNNYSYKYVDDDYTLTVTYSSSSNKFSFELTDGYFVAKLSAFNKNTSDINVTIKERECDASATIKKTTYNLQTLTFKITNNTSNLSDSAWQSLVNTDLRLTVSETQLFLIRKVGISLQDLGFTAYQS